MQRLIGVFDTRADAEQATRELISRGVEQDSITFLTREQDSPVVQDAKGLGKIVGGFSGGAVGAGVGATAGAALATLLVPGIGPVIAIGVGAAALLGIGGAAAGAAVGEGIEGALDHGIASGHNAENVAFFHRSLNEGKSLLVVNVASEEQAQLVNSIFDRHSLRKAS